MALDLSLKGKHALVCGASVGIGRAIALGLAGQGAAVAVLARRVAALEGLLPELRAAGAPAAWAIGADLDERDEAVAAVRNHMGRHGELEIVINNTGGPPGGPILEAEPEAFEQAFARHVLAAHALVKLALPGMRRAGYGRFVNIISTSVREPIANLGVSNTIRGAMASWSKTVSKELPPGITINNVLPGYTDTERLDELRSGVAKRTGRSEEQVNEAWLGLVPEGRLGEPREIAAAVVFLASPAASFVRGVSLAVDGGRMASI